MLLWMELGQSLKWKLTVTIKSLALFNIQVNVQSLFLSKLAISKSRVLLIHFS